MTTHVQAVEDTEYPFALWTRSDGVIVELRVGAATAPPLTATKRVARYFPYVRFIPVNRQPYRVGTYESPGKTLVGVLHDLHHARKVQQTWDNFLEQRSDGYVPIEPFQENDVGAQIHQRLKDRFGAPDGGATQVLLREIAALHRPLLLLPLVQHKIAAMCRLEKSALSPVQFSHLLNAIVFDWNAGRPKGGRPPKPTEPTALLVSRVDAIEAGMAEYNRGLEADRCSNKVIKTRELMEKALRALGSLPKNQAKKAIQRGREYRKNPLKSRTKQKLGISEHAAYAIPFVDDIEALPKDLDEVRWWLTAWLLSPNGIVRIVNFLKEDPEYLPVTLLDAAFRIGGYGLAATPNSSAWNLICEANKPGRELPLWAEVNRTTASVIVDNLAAKGPYELIDWEGYRSLLDALRTPGEVPVDVPEEDLDLAWALLE